MLDFKIVIDELNTRIDGYQDEAIARAGSSFGSTSNMLANSLIELKNTLLEKNSKLLVVRNNKYTSLEKDYVEILRESRSIYFETLSLSGQQPNIITAIRALRAATKDTKAYPGLGEAKRFIEQFSKQFNLKY